MSPISPNAIYRGHKHRSERNIRIMSATKVAVSLDSSLLQRLDKLIKAQLFRNRSHAIQEAVSEKIRRRDKSRLAKECAKLQPKFEQAMAEEGLATEIIQ